MKVAKSHQLMGALLAGMISFGGCGGDAAPAAAPLQKVKGKVVFKDASALKDLKIHFIPINPTGRTADGDIKSDGTFELKSGAADGISEGEYHVRLVKPINGKGKAAPSPIASQYFDDDGSFLTATIKSDTTEIPPFDLKPLAKGTSGKGARDND